MKMEKMHKVVILLTIFLLVGTSITYILVNERIVEKQPPSLYGTFYNRKIDEKNDTISFTILLSSPEKTKNWTIKFMTPDGKYDEIDYEYIDSQNDGFLNSGDKIVVYNRSKYIDYTIVLFVHGYGGCLDFTILPLLHGTLGDIEIDKESETISFTIELSSPKKTKNWTLWFVSPDGKTTELDYEYIDVQKDGYLNSEDKIVVYNRSKYIDYEVVIKVYGYEGTIHGVIV